MNNILYLVWYEKEKKILNLIGQLTYDDIDEKYFFKYLNYESNELQLFSKNGLFPGFMDINQIYISPNLFLPILKRLPSKKRDDYSKIMAEYGFDEKSTDFEVLRQTKGASCDDHFIFITEDEYYKLKNEIKYY